MKEGTPAEPTPPDPPVATMPTGIMERRIREVVQRMVDGTFVRGKTVKELAAAWGLTEDYVRHEITGPASKLVRAACDTETIAGEVVVTLRKVMRRSLKSPQTYKDANAAANHLADIYGLKQPKKHELTGKDGAAIAVATVSYDPKTMSDEQLERIARGEPPGPGDPRRSRSGT